MSETSIQWTDCVWNPVRGCSRVSEGCRHCYAERTAARFADVGKPFFGFANIGPRAGEHHWTGKVELIPSKLDEPLRWKKPRRVFVNSMSDLFHEKLPNAAIAAVFGVMAAASRHTFQILTKRPERMREWFTWIAGFPCPAGQAWRCVDMARGAGAFSNSRVPSWFPGEGYSWPLPNVWLGVSAEDQTTLRERAWLLLKTPAARRFVSLEPLLGSVDLNEPELLCKTWRHGATIGTYLDWVIVGGESGPGARPCDLAWIRSVVEQCKAVDCSVFVKQLGARPITDHRTRPAGENAFVLLKDRKGGDPEEWPADFRVREFPR